jgi:hypothetical protein
MLLALYIMFLVTMCLLVAYIIAKQDLEDELKYREALFNKTQKEGKK